MLGVIGDLVEDVVVMLAGPPARGTDTTATIARTRGGSAANVAAATASTGAAVCFIGRVGDDPVGSRLVDELVAGGVDVRVQRGGRTGAIVVLVEPDGERTMLSDRGAAVELDGLDPAWLLGVTWLHVPAYSLCAEPIGAAAHQAIAVVRAAGGRVSVDVSSVALVDGFGAARFAELLVELAPDVVLANAEEAMRLDGVPASWRLVVKCGADPVVVVEPDGARTEV
ncbi:MAG: sugar kinase, partial [Acidimicrobiia bacterium]|nr:sugar kinase [Acidimicrobiia bacterium]